MKDETIKRLESLGYSFEEKKDGWVVGFIIDKVSNLIKNEINQSEIPKDLYQVFGDMVCGEFLKAAKASGNLEGFSVDLDSAVLKQKSQGDTAFTFATDKINSAEERLDAVIEHLLNYGKPQLLAFRRFNW